MTERDRGAAEIPHYVNGQRAPGRSGHFGDVYNPASGEVTGRVPLASVAEIDAAVEAAAAAFPGWAATPPHMRARVLFGFRDLVERESDPLAAIVAAEHGRVVADAKGELTRGLGVVEFACGIPQMLK